MAELRCVASTIFCSSGAAVPVGIDRNSSKCRLKPITAAPRTTAVQQSFPFCSRRAVSSIKVARSHTQLQGGHGTAHRPASWRANLATTHSSTAAAHRWDAMPLTAAHYTPANGHVRSQQHMPPGWGSNDASLVQSFQQLFQPERPSAAARQHNQQQQQQSNRAGSGGSPTATQGNQRTAVSPDTARLHFSVVHPVQYGQYLRLVGSSKALGSWDAQRGPDMRWHDGHKWTADVQLAVGSHEFKFVTVHRSGEVEWEAGSNRVLQVPASAAEMHVQGTWGDTLQTEVLQVQEHQTFAERRHLLQQLLTDAASAAEADASAASAAAAAETLLSMLDFEQQQEKEQQRGTAVAGSQPTMASASVSAVQQQQQHSSEHHHHQQQRVGGETIPGSSSSTTALSTAAADTAGVSAALVNTHEQLVSMLLEMRAELTSSISDVTTAIKEVQQELGQVQEQVAQLTAERLLQQHLQQQQRPGGAAAALLDATSSLDDQANTGFDAAVLGLQHQWLSAADNNSSSSSNGMLPSSGYTLKWKQSSSQASQDEQQQQQQEQQPPVSCQLSAPPPAAAGLSHDMLPSTSNSLQNQVVATPAAALNDLNSTVIAWRHEVLSFKQEAMLLRAEVAGLAETLELLEQQLAANTTALNSLKALVEQQQQQQQPQQQEGREQRKRRAEGSNAGSSSSSSSSSSSATAGAAPGASVATAAAVEEQLLAKFDELASQLTAEVRNVVQSAVPQQQQIDLLQQLLENEQLLNQLWTRPPPLEEHTELQQQHQQQQQYRYSTGRDMPSSSSGYDEAAAAAAHLLGSNNVQQYHKGLLLCVMLAAGLWEEKLLDCIQGETMRLTWRGYKACWGDDLLSRLKHRLNSPEQLLAELQHSSSGFVNTLACHVLWSLMELSTHSTQVAAQLQRCASITDMQLLGQLRPDAPHPGCAAVLRRWIAAATAVQQ